MPEINLPEVLARNIDPEDFLLGIRIEEGQPSLVAADEAQQFAQRYRFEADATLAVWAKSNDVVGGQIVIPTATWTDYGFESADGPWYNEIAAIPETSTGTLRIAQARATKRNGSWSQTPWTMTTLNSGFVEWATDATGTGATSTYDDTIHTHYRARLGDGTWAPWEPIVSGVQDRGWIRLVDDRDAYPTAQGQGKAFSAIRADLDRHDILRIIVKIFDGYTNGVRGEILGTMYADFPTSEIQLLNRQTSGYYAGRTLRTRFDKDSGGRITHSRTDTQNDGTYQTRVAFRINPERASGDTSSRVMERIALKRISWTGQIDHFSLSVLIR